MFSRLLWRKPEVSDRYRTLEEVVEDRGFKFEAHEVQTKDGYILTIHRIVNPRFERLGLEARPVLLQHGFGGNGCGFVVNSDDGHVEPLLDDNLNKKSQGHVGNNLGFELAKRGYDVWLGNNRGNKFARKHVTLDSMKDVEYWDYSLDEMALYDLPQTIDYILNKTNSSTLGYVGVSNASTMMLALLSTECKYNDIIKPFIALTPVGSLKHIKTPFRHILTNRLVICVLKQPGPAVPVWAENGFKNLITGHVMDGVTQTIYQGFLKLLLGYDSGQVDWTRMPTIINHIFENVAKRQVLHFVQGYTGEIFSRFDFGPKTNREVYGQEKAPRYPVERITNPFIAFISTQSDILATQENIDYLRDNLTVPLFEDHVVPLETMGHWDCQFGKDAGKYVYSKVIQILENCENISSKLP